MHSAGGSLSWPVSPSNSKANGKTVLVEVTVVFEEEKDLYCMGIK